MPETFFTRGSAPSTEPALARANASFPTTGTRLSPRRDRCVLASPRRRTHEGLLIRCSNGPAADASPSLRLISALDDKLRLQPRFARDAAPRPRAASTPTPG